MALGEMAWQWPIWIDLWAAGMAGGAYLVAFFINRFTGGANINLFRLAVYTGVPLAIIGVLLLVIDLGTPIWFWHLFVNFKPIAVMSMGTWTLFSWIIVAFLMMIMWVIDGDATRKPELYPNNMAGKMRSASGFLSWIGLILAALLMTYTGVLLGATAQPIWAASPLFPALFVASAVCTGAALLILMSLVINAVNKGSSATMHSIVKWLFGSTGWTISNGTIGRLAKGLAGIATLQVVVLIGYAVWLSVSSVAGAGDALALLTTGSLAIPFWAGVVLVGLLVPLVILLANWSKALEAKYVTSLVVAASACVLLGGLVLRAVMAVGGQL